jgi:hypothetical protein
VDGADAACASAEVGPIGKATGRGRKSSENAKPDQSLGGCLCFFSANEIKRERTHPSAYDNVGQGWMERMTEPRAAERVLDRRSLRDR